MDFLSLVSHSGGPGFIYQLLQHQNRLHSSSYTFDTTARSRWATSKYRVSFQTIRTVTYDHAIQQRCFNCMLHGRRRRMMNTVVFWGVTLCGLVNCHRRFDRTTPHGVLLIYCTTGVFTLTGSVSKLILSHDSQ